MRASPVGADDEADAARPGAYCVLFLASLYVLFHKWKGRGTDRTVVMLHFCLFVACTLHYALEFNHFYRTLVSATLSHEESIRSS